MGHFTGSRPRILWNDSGLVSRSAGVLTLVFTDTVRPIYSDTCVIAFPLLPNVAF